MWAGRGWRVDARRVRAVDAEADYIHLSLSDPLTATPLDAEDGETILARFVAHVAGRAPVIAAGRTRALDQAARALLMGLPLVAVGQGLVMNPRWVERDEAMACRA